MFEGCGYKLIYIYGCATFYKGAVGQEPKRRMPNTYADQVCRTGMPNTYAEQLDTETTFGKESAPEGYAEQGMPNRVCRTGMPNRYAEKLSTELGIREQH